MDFGQRSTTAVAVAVARAYHRVEEHAELLRAERHEATSG